MKYAYLFINNDPGRVSDSIMSDVVQANLLQQVEDLAPAYGLEPSLVSEHPAADPVPVSTEVTTFIPVYLRPSVFYDPPGAVAFHWVNPDTGRPECHVLTDVVEELGGPGDFTDKLSGAASHECCEARRDLLTDLWVDLPNGRQEAAEICDRVQCSTYSKTVASGRTVQVSNFLLEAGFALEPLPEGTKVDFLGLIPSSDPRQILAEGDGAGGGYAAIRDRNGNVAQVYGDKVSALRYSHKSMVERGVALDELIGEWREELTPVVDVPTLPVFDDTDVKPYDAHREGRAERATEAVDFLLKWIEMNPGDQPSLERAALGGITTRANVVVGEENAKLKGQAQD